MAISKPVTGETFNEDQCQGLSRYMGRYLLPMLPRGQRNWPDGSLYLIAVAMKAKTSRPTTITTTRRPHTTYKYDKYFYRDDEIQPDLVLLKD